MTGRGHSLVKPQICSQQLPWLEGCWQLISVLSSNMETLVETHQRNSLPWSSEISIRSLSPWSAHWDWFQMGMCKTAEREELLAACQGPVVQLQWAKIQ